MAKEKTPSTDDVEIVNEPTLPELELPDYHGRKPSGMKTAITGAGNRLSRAHEIGERVILVIEAKVKKAGHEELDDGLEYVEGLKVVDLFEIGGTPGKRLLSSVRQAYRLADDQVKGKKALENDDVDLGSAGVTDSSGNVLTPKELAELRGDPVRAMLEDATTPVVVVYSDGAREIWPDEFEKDAPRPAAGDRFEVDGDDGPAAYVYVEELLHGDTGETLARWTKDQENERLLALEQAAEATEAAEAKATDGRAAYYRLEFASGAVEEIVAAKAPAPAKSAIPAEKMAEAAKVVAVMPDGAETVLKDRSGMPDDDVEPLDPGTPPLPGEDLEQDLEPLEGEPLEPTFVEDEDGFAEPVMPEPTKKDFEVVDRPIDELPDALKKIRDVPRAKRILEAERRGRGRSLKTRKGAVDLILGRIADLEEIEAKKAADDA